MKTMKPFFQTILSPLEGAFVVGSFIVLAIAIFVLWPAISRKADKNAGRVLAQARVIASFGGPIFRMGGAFYRVTAYERHLVVCFLVARSYPYQNVRVVRDEHTKGGKLTIALYGVCAELQGNADSIHRLAKVLSQQGCTRT
ncbi:hypothetical protein J2797_005079 [Paraburkholderia terricola]|uniref:hypothetical protein n=1 Tax=Paraburkholderia terricola TaxID=169427 RepID=UPI002854AF1C|nr:hypothetical protein [Paraburkholderia terricola]MDR6495163.1 hypothetical protein [Paraburkholderia terricola]